MSDSFTIIDDTRSKAVRALADGLPFREMKDAALGEAYELELVFVAPEKMRDLNRDHRGKDKPTNILSFPLDAASGQIFICPSLAKEEAPAFGRDFDNYLAFLFIHGLLHLKGYDHGSTMESEERKIRAQFGI